MSTLADAAVRVVCRERLTRLNPSARPRWGRMTAHQMVCHVSDSFAVGAGTRSVSPGTGFLQPALLQRTIVKWLALRSPLPWPHGIPTPPELEQGRGGTPPAQWEADCSLLRGRMEELAGLENFGVHPFFGALNRSDWLVLGYRHMDHHLRQFGV